MITSLIVFVFALSVYSIADEIAHNTEIKRPVKLFLVDNQIKEDLKAWHAEMKATPSSFSSNLNYKTSKFYSILSEGCKISHVLFEEYFRGDRIVGVFFPELLKMKYNSYFDRKTKTYLFNDYPDYTYYPPAFHEDSENKNHYYGIWEYWWKEGRKLTPQIFQKKYKAYISLAERKQTFNELQNMGIIILPNILEKMEEGDESLLPMFAYLSGQKNLKDVSECRKWWDANKEDFHDLLNY